MSIKFKYLILATAAVIAACGGSSGSSVAPSQNLINIAVDNATTPTKLYVTDYNLDVVAVASALTGTATLSAVAGSTGYAGATNGNGTAATFNGLEGVVVDSSGNLFVADAKNAGIRKITTPASTAAVTTFAGTLGTTGTTDATGTSALFNTPRGMAIDGSNNIYVADAFNQTVRQITSAGVVTTLAGYAGTTGVVNGTGTAARFNYPFGVAEATVGGAATLFVSDSSNHAIRQIIISTGVVTTLAGSIGNAGYSDATGTNALFDFPLGIATDGTNVYVADSVNNVIRKIVISSGLVTTLAGNTSGTAGFTNGTGTAAYFSYPTGLTYGGGNLYVVDQGGTHIRIVAVSNGATTTLY